MDSKVVDNGLDFILRAAQELWDKSLSKEQESKYSTVHLYEGVELILKARLMREHWSLILTNPDRFGGAPLESGDFISVGFDQALVRLSKLYGVSLTKSQETAFNELRKLRNRYVHFACTETRESVVGVQLRAWHELLLMLDDGFLDKLSGHQKTLMKDAKGLMTASEEFLEARLKAIQPALKKLLQQGTVIARCPSCQLDALVIEEAKCRVCETDWEYPSEIAEAYAAMNDRRWAKDGGELVYCDNCGEDCCVPAGAELNAQAEKILNHLRVEPGLDLNTYICFACAEFDPGWDMHECGSCGAKYFAADKDSICPAEGCRGF
jgi:hypothetical protein